MGSQVRLQIYYRSTPGKQPNKMWTVLLRRYVYHLKSWTERATRQSPGNSLHIGFETGFVQTEEFLLYRSEALAAGSTFLT